MSSVVQICNAALTALGADSIVSLTEASEQARLCKSRYESVRDAVLRAHPWNGAVARATLPAASETPLFGYLYRYSLPTDPYCLRVLKLAENAAFRTAGRFLETDAAPPVRIEFIKRVEDPNDFDSLLSEAISARLAAEIAYKLTGSGQVREEQWRLYLAVVAEARGLDAIEWTPEVDDGSSWLTVRN